MELDDVTPENFMDYFNKFYWQEKNSRSGDALKQYLSQLKLKAIEHKTLFEKNNPSQSYEKTCLEIKYQKAPLEIINRNLFFLESRKKRIWHNPVDSSTIEKFREHYFEGKTISHR